MDETPVTVWDVDAGCQREVTRAEAAAGMVRYARSLGAGTPACGEYERHALLVSGVAGQEASE